jgi:hypothetical protein
VSARVDDVPAAHECHRGVRVGQVDREHTVELDVLGERISSGSSSRPRSA